MTDFDRGITLAELHDWLQREVVRANASFCQVQQQAAAALAHELVPGDERLAIAALEIAELQLQFSVARVRPCWPIRIWHWLSGWGRTKRRPAAPRYRLVAQHAAEVTLNCFLKRAPGGAFAMESMTSTGGADARVSG